MRDKKLTFRKVFVNWEPEIQSKLESQNISAESIEEMQKTGFLDLNVIKIVLEENSLLNA